MTYCYISLPYQCLIVRVFILIIIIKKNVTFLLLDENSTVLFPARRNINRCEQATIEPWSHYFLGGDGGRGQGCRWARYFRRARCFRGVTTFGILKVFDVTVRGSEVYGSF